MGFDDAYQLGYIKKTHGLDGHVVAHLDVDDPTYYTKLESVFLNQGGALIPFFITTFKLRGSEAIMGLEEYDSIDQASPLVGTELWLPLAALPDLPEGAFYYHDLVGYELFNEDDLVGTVEHIYTLPTNHLLGVKHVPSQKEVLVPTQDGVMGAVDHEARKIYTTLPDGLIELYTTEE